MAAAICRWASAPTGRPVGCPRTARKDSAFHTKPHLAWELIQEPQAARIPFRLVVADRVYGESAELGAQRFAALPWPWHLAAGGRSGQPTGLHSRRGGPATPS